LSKKSYLNITIVLKPKAIKDFNNLVPNIISWLQKRKKNVQFLESDKDRILKFCNTKTINSINFINENHLFKKSDLIISLGGDGTLIGVGRRLTKSQTPVFGVNMGTLGFINEFTKKEFFEDLARFFNNKLKTISKNLFSIKIYKKNKLVHNSVFVNDAVISKHDISRMFTISVEANDEHLYDLSGDGLIVSSPTGSTAYSMAAGGPILHPDVKGIVLTPVCPHSLTHRPLVVPASYEIKIQLIDKIDHVLLTLDGQEAIPISNTDIIKISLNKQKLLRIIKNPDRSFFHTLKEKFVHGRREA